MSTSVLDGALLGLAYQVFDLCEGLLDGIEVRGVWRQILEPCAHGLDHLPYGSRLMASKIIHDDEIARLQHSDELLLDVGTEALAIDWPVEDARRGGSITAQRAEEGQWRQWPCGAGPAQPLAPWPPTTQWSHAGLDLGPSMKTRHCGSRPPCRDHQRWRRRAMSVRACSRANSVF